MKKYVVYYREMTYLKNGKSQPREYFKVESHPKLPKPWVSSKSTKIPLLEKLNDANQVVSDLENTMGAGPDPSPGPHPDPDQDTSNPLQQRWIKYLPKYTRLRVNRQKKDNSTILSLIYDRKDTSNGFRWTAVYTFIYNQPMTDGVDDTDPDPDDKAAISLGLQHLRNKLREKYGADVLGL